MAGIGSSTRVRQQVEKWRDELLDLTGNNRLLRFRASKLTLEVESPGAQQLIARLLNGRSRSWVIFLPYEEPDLDASSSSDPGTGGSERVGAAGHDPGSTLVTHKGTAREVLAACAGLSRRATQEFMDKGIWILYLGVGMLTWTDPADRGNTEQDSPLLMVPVELVAERGRDGWRLVPAENEVVVNPALWLKLESELGIELPEPGDEESIDVPAFLAEVRVAVAGHPTWTVRERVVLSTFSFYKEAMYRDVRDNIERIVEHPVVSALASDPGDVSELGTDFAFDPVPESSLDTAVPPEHAMTIRDADASQRQCIAAALAGRSFVMDGPPGTGKSQTIANIIAELIAQGKTVLFVSEKAAALDVVYKRLDEAGIGDFMLELHSHKTTRKAVASALGDSLLRRPRSAPLLTDADLAQAERKRIDLTSYADALNAPLDVLGGRTLHHLLGLISRLQHLPQAPVAERPLASPAELEAVERLGARLESSWEVVERGEDFVWAGAAARSWGAAVEQRVHEALNRAADELRSLKEIGEAAAEDVLLPPPSGPAAAAKLGELLEHLGRRPERLVEGWLSEVAADDLEATAMGHANRIELYRRAVADAEGVLGAQWHLLNAQAEDCVRIWTEVDELPASMAPEWTVGDIERLSDAAARVGSEYKRLSETSSELAVCLGLRATDLTPMDGQAIRVLAGIAQNSERLDARWLASWEAIESAREALDELEPLLVAEHEARAAAAPFTSAVLDLDLEDLQSRFRNEHRGLKRLGGAYKTDRAALAATAPEIKPKAAIEQIGTAVAWQVAHRALHADAQRYGELLGAGWQGRENRGSKSP